MPQAPDDATEQLEWLLTTITCSSADIYQLAEAIEHGAADLPIARSAWVNSMAALTWAVEQHVAGRVQWTAQSVATADVERVRRLSELGLAVLDGGPRSSEITVLSEQVLTMLYGGDWKSLMPDVVVESTALTCSQPPS